jgi:hypothetical protein
MNKTSKACETNYHWIFSWKTQDKSKTSKIRKVRPFRLVRNVRQVKPLRHVRGMGLMTIGFSVGHIRQKLDKLDL